MSQHGSAQLHVGSRLRAPASLVEAHDVRIAADGQVGREVGAGGSEEDPWADAPADDAGLAVEVAQPLSPEVQARPSPRGDWKFQRARTGANERPP